MSTHSPANLLISFFLTAEQNSVELAESARPLAEYTINNHQV